MVWFVIFESVTIVYLVGIVLVLAGKCEDTERQLIETRRRLYRVLIEGRNR